MMETLVLRRQPLPTGFRFQPTDKEIVDYFLISRNLVCDPVIGVPDINDTSLDPWHDKYKDELSYQGNDNDWWFFSSRTRGKDTSRLTESGKWKNNSGYNDIMGGDDEIRGKRIDFTFFCRQADGGYERFINWKLYEYRLTDDRLNGLLPPNEKTYFALCHLSYKEDNTKNKTRVEGRRTNGEISSPTQPRQRRRMRESVVVPLQPAPQEISFSHFGLQRDNPSNSQEDQLPLFSDDEQWQTELFLQGVEQPLEAPSMPMPPQSLKGMLHGNIASSSQQNTYLLGNQRAQSAQSLSGIVPPEEKKTSIENINGECTAANPHRKKISTVKIEENKNLAQEAGQKLRINLGPILTSQNKSSLPSPIKYFFNFATGLVMMIWIFSQMFYVGIILLVWILLILLLVKPDLGLVLQ